MFCQDLPLGVLLILIMSERVRTKYARALCLSTCAFMGSLLAEGCHGQADQAPIKVIAAKQASLTPENITVVTTSPPTTKPEVTEPTIASTLPSPKPNVGVPVNWLNKLPSLLQLGVMFPTKFPNVTQELSFINTIKNEVSVTLQEYTNFKINTQYENAFANQPTYSQRITPSAFVIHWTAETYPNRVNGLISEMQKRGERVEFFIDPTGETYQLFDSDNRYPAHARGANNFTQGVEIEADNAYGYTPQEIDSAIMLAVNFDRRNHLPVNASTIVGHYAIDLLYDNLTYNNNSGTFGINHCLLPHVDKIDPPQEVMAFIDQDALTLNAELGQ